MLYSCMKPKSVVRPSKRAIGQIAENQPEMLNLLVAYFVFEWKAVRVGTPPHGVDQNGTTCLIPNYVDMWTDQFEGIDGVNEAVYYLLRSPKKRAMDAPGFITTWLATL